MKRKLRFYVILILFTFTITSLLIAIDNSDYNEDRSNFIENLLNRRRQLNANSELVRFFDDDGNTEFHINFKINNNDLHFTPEAEGLVARLEIKLDIYRDDELVKEERYMRYLGARNMASAQSSNFYFLDKIELLINREGFSAILEIQDRNANTYYTQKYDLNLLNENSLISDIEISSAVTTDLIDDLDKFQRGQYQFYVSPLPILDGNERHFNIFFQVANISLNDDSKHVIEETIKIKQDDITIWEHDNNHTLDYMPYSMVRRIPLADLSPGLYTIEVTIKDIKSQTSYSTNKNFSVFREYIQYTERVFTNDNEEFELISYFLNNRERRAWRGLNDDGRKNFIERFWGSRNPNSAANTNYFLEIIRERVNEANWRYAHHRAGWRTDMGRIYIKYGAPDTIDRRDTVAEARYSRQPYQIWRYNSTARIYVFLDFQGNGNFRLIWVRNDESELTDPGWKGYFGNDFEESSFLD